MKIGIDIQKTNSFKKFEENKKFYNKIFSESERLFCLKRKDYKSCFCGKFCIKEATIKAFDKKLSLSDIEVLNDPSGKPYIKIKSKRDKNIEISLSHSEDICVGVVILK